MFTGIIEELGTIRSIKPIGNGREFEIGCSFASEVHIDQSISVNGVCQTVTRKNDMSFTVQSVEETLRKTALGDLRQGDQVNLERTLALQQGIEGHLVQGHVDTAGEVVSIDHEGANWIFTIGYPDEFRDLIVGRGSIAVDGISLTVAREEGRQFTVAIIPYTYEHTNMKLLKPGDRVNLEFDMLGKYVVRFLNNRSEAGDKGITKDWLKEMGY